MTFILKSRNLNKYIKMADPKNFANKIVIDVTNPLDFSKGMTLLMVK
jgi:predicted dinucleotide-binding enzyme